jgi:hypothetical protein
MFVVGFVCASPEFVCCLIINVHSHISLSPLSPIPTVSSTPPPRSTLPVVPAKSVIPKLLAMPGNAARLTAKGVMATGRGIISAYKWTSESITTQRERPAVAREYRAHLWEEAKLEGRHYWMGSKLLAAEVRMSVGLLRQIASGIELTRRERQLLRRIMGDMVRMVPLIVILIVPFAELALPVLLKVFPTFLPSQFQKNELRQDLYRRSLTARIELHGVLADVLADHTAAASKKINVSGGASGDASSASSSSAALLKDVEAVRSGAQLDASTIVRVASLFKDELTLDTLPHAQLVMLAKYVGLKPFVPDVILRSQLRKKIKEIKEDDVMLLAEGGGQRLTKAELKAACETRGMRAIGLTEQRYAEQLDEWLALSVKSQVPVTLLFLSRSLSLAVAPGAETVAPAGGAPSAWRAPVATDETAAALQESLSAIDQAVVAEMVIDNAVTPQGEGISSGSGSTSTALASSSSANLVSTSNVQAPSNVSSSSTTTPLATTAITQQKTRETAVLKLKLDALAYQESLIAAERESLQAAEALRQAQAESFVKAAAAATAAADPAREREAFALAAEASASATRAASAATAAETKHTAFVRLTSKGATTAAVATAAFSEVRAAANDDEIAKQLAPLALAGALLGKEKAAFEALRSAPPVIAADRPADAAEKYLQTKMSALSSTIEREVKQAEASGMRGALVVADADRDGYLALHELQAAAAKVAGKGATPPQALQALFERLDSRRTGKVAISDVLTFLEKADAKAAAAGSDADVTQISKK